LILQNQGNAVLAQQVRKARVEPVPVANLDSELVIWRELFQERSQSGDELRAAAEHDAIEKRKLKDHRAELSAEQFHDTDELTELCIAIDENFLVSDLLRNFHRENELVRGFSIPPSDGRG
jgi:hypothetical protein